MDKIENSSNYKAGAVFENCECNIGCHDSILLRDYSGPSELMEAVQLSSTQGHGDKVCGELYLPGMFGNNKPTYFRAFFHVSAYDNLNVKYILTDPGKKDELKKICQHALNCDYTRHHFGWLCNCEILNVLGIADRKCIKDECMEAETLSGCNSFCGSINGNCKDSSSSYHYPGCFDPLCKPK